MGEEAGRRNIVLDRMLEQKSDFERFLMEVGSEGTGVRKEKQGWKQLVKQLICSELILLYLPNCISCEFVSLILNIRKI